MKGSNGRYNKIMGVLLLWAGGFVAYASWGKLMAYVGTGHIAVAATARSSAVEGPLALVEVAVILFFGLWLAASGLHLFFKK
jgi:hypothetical protein